MERHRLFRDSDIRSGKRKVLLWLFRDFRLVDNWAVSFAQRNFRSKNIEVWVFPDYFSDNTIGNRRSDFIRRGMMLFEKECRQHSIQLRLVFLNDPPSDLTGVEAVVIDFSPLKEYSSFINNLLDRYKDLPPVYQVDSHNIIPCWSVGQLVHNASSMRRKMDGWRSLALPPKVRKGTASVKNVDWNMFFLPCRNNFNMITYPIVSYPHEVLNMNPHSVLDRFINKRLSKYSDLRNDPNAEVLSGLSPWINLGLISTQRIAVTVAAYKNSESFVEELVVRRELAENFCYYSEKGYRSIDCAPGWAQRTLNKHAKDRRDFVYSMHELQFALTHDSLWNAAQVEMVVSGKMHCYMRMYWAKKILEWTPDPATALEYAIELNDMYSMDGEDPNGYVGCLWSICGVHDRPWKERPVFGTVRYMNRAGCERKFDVGKYIQRAQFLVSFVQEYSWVPILNK